MRPVVMFAAVLSCAYSIDTPANAQEIEQSANDRLADFLYDPFDPAIGHSLVFEDAYTRVVERFGEPAGVLEEPARSRDPTRPINHVTLSYSRMSITLSRPVGSTETIISRIVLDDGDRDLKYGLGIGSTRAEIEAVFEQAPRLTNPYRFDSEYTDIRYDYPARPGEPVSVTTFTELAIEFDENGRSTQMIWEHYAD